MLAERIGAAIVYLEHRYQGESSPFSELTTANLTYLNVPNIISDLTNFANNVQLPFAQKGYRSNAADVPWILLGSSYAGNLAAWTASVRPGTFWAYHASSAPLQAIADYWQYWLPIQRGMPANCSKDVPMVIDYMDNIWVNGTTEEIDRLKSIFGLPGFEPVDIMAALKKGPARWQSLDFWRMKRARRGTLPFHRWCDYIEGAFTTSPNGTTCEPTNFTSGPEGVGLTKALQGYAKWFTTYKLPGFCASYKYFDGKYNTECLNSFNHSSPFYTDISVKNEADRAWTWLLCNEPFGAWQTGGPPNRPALASRLLTVENEIRRCHLYFPPGPKNEAFGIAKGKTTEQLNLWTGGWNLAANPSRLSFSNGEYDAWVHETVSSDFRPGGPLASSKQAPIFNVPGGFHCSDTMLANREVNPGAKKAMDQVVSQLVEWVAEWSGSVRNHSKAANSIFGR